MKKYFYMTAGFLLSLIILFQGCSEEPLPSLYDLVTPGGIPPEINSITPAEPYVMVTPITITGSNFSPVPQENNVYFNGYPGVVLSSTPNELTVLSANVISDSVQIKVSVSGAENFSNTLKHPILPIYAELKNSSGNDLFSATLVPHGITTDAQGNVYTSVTENNVGAGIRKVSPSGKIIPAGDIEFFAPKGVEASIFHKINMWQNNTIVGTWRVPGVFTVNEGSPSAVFVQLATAVNDIDFDAGLNIWAGGRGLFRITPAKEVKSFANPNPIKAIRVFDGHLYTLTTVDGNDIIRRRPIIGDDLGAEVDVFNIGGTILPDTGIIKIEGTDFEFAADGDIIVGTSKPTLPIIVVHPNGTFDPLYPGVIPANTRVYAFAWGPGEYLYFTREKVTTADVQSIYRLSMQRLGAPNYGR